MFQNDEVEVEATIRYAMFRKVWEVGFDEYLSLAIGQNCERPIIRLGEHLVLCRMEEEAKADPGPQAGEPLDLRAFAHESLDSQSAALETVGPYTCYSSRFQWHTK